MRAINIYFVIIALLKIKTNIEVYIYQASGSHYSWHEKKEMATEKWWAAWQGEVYPFAVHRIISCPLLGTCVPGWQAAMSHGTQRQKCKWLDWHPVGLVAFVMQSPAQKRSGDKALSWSVTETKRKSRDLPCSPIIRCERPLKERERERGSKKKRIKQKKKQQYLCTLVTVQYLSALELAYLS